MATTMSIAPQSLLAALLCTAITASFLLRGTSAAATATPSSASPLMTQTCAKTSNARLCIDDLLLLHYSDRSIAATTVHELAVVALTAARRSALHARILWQDLSYRANASSPPVADRLLVVRCTALYRDCLVAGAKALGRVPFMAAYDSRVGHAVSALRRFPEKCQELFDERKLVSPLEKVNRETKEKLRSRRRLFICCALTSNGDRSADTFVVVDMLHPQ